MKLVKATQLFERLSIDFKGPLPSKVHPFLLTMRDEYFKFPFAYPVKDVSTPTLIKCLGNLFSIFGMPSYVHSDSGPSFMSEKLKWCLFEKGSPPVEPHLITCKRMAMGLLGSQYYLPSDHIISLLMNGKEYYQMHFTQFVHYSVLLLMLLRMNVFLTFRDNQQMVPLWHHG